MAVGAVVGVTAALLGQLVQPFHLLTHEFTQLFAVLAGAVVLLSGWRIGRVHPPAWTLWLAAVQGVVLGLAATGTQLLANAALHDCKVTDALFFFWITWVPIALFMGVIGTVTGELELRLRSVLAGVIVLFVASALNDAVQGLVGVRLVDPLIGDVLFFDQRLDMEVPVSHVFQRAWLLAASASLWLARRWWVRPDPLLGATAALMGGAWLAVTLAAGSHIGVGWGRGAIHAHLDGTTTTDHFTIRYRSTGRSSLYADAIGRAAEWHWHTLTRDWGIDPDRRVELRLFDTNNDLRRLTGIGNAHAGLYRISMPWSRALSSTLQHELVHALHAEISWRPDLLLLRGILEGTAEAWAADLIAVPEAHKQQAAALRAGRLPDASVFMKPLGFFRVNERNAYASASSFMGWLVMEHGLEPFLQLQRSLDFEQAYGQDLVALDAGWRTFLDGVDVGLADKARAREEFDPESSPSYLSRKCPKLGPRQERAQDEAQRRYRNGDYAGALEVYTRLLAKRPKARHAVRAAWALDRLGRTDEALALLDGAPFGSADDDQVHMVLQHRISLLRSVQDWDALYAALDARAELTDSAPDEARHAELLLRDPDLRAPVARALTLGSSSDARVLLRQLAADHPDNVDVQYLAATRAYPLPTDRTTLSLTPEWVDRIETAVAWLDATPGACDDVAGRLLSVVETAVDTRRPDLAERVAQLVVARCQKALPRYRAATLLERIAWERELTP